MKVSDVIAVIEKAAPLRLQEEFDNSGLQVGFPDAQVSKVLVCLDVTEEVVFEATAIGCNMIVSHHPLLYHPLRQVSGASYQQRCVVDALANGIAIYSAHTSLDNAPGGVNYRLASMLGLEDLSWLQPRPDGAGGSGVVGMLPEAIADDEFLRLLKSIFAVECLHHTAPCGKPIRKVALCGGSGAFLMQDAIRMKADAFITGELHYHDYFESDGMLLAALGHYQSEISTVDLLHDIIAASLPELEIVKTSVNTNAVKYDSFQVL